MRDHNFIMIIFIICNDNDNYYFLLVGAGNEAKDINVLYWSKFVILQLGG